MSTPVRSHNPAPSLAAAANEPSATEDRFALRSLQLGHGRVAWREAGQGTPLVLLHGIGSGSGSWAGQLAALSVRHRVIAWDAPGYGESDPLPESRPLGDDYATVLADWLGRIDAAAPIVVGHSLGAIVAATWASRAGVAPRALLLASPARGYGGSPADQREAKFRERVELVERLGVAGLAASRAAGLCAPGAADAVVEAVRRNMARTTPGGYAQAAWMLANDDLRERLRSAPRPLAVLCGELDRITPPQACAALAEEVGAPFVPLRGVAHACYVEDPSQFNAALASAIEEARHG